MSISLLPIYETKVVQTTVALFKAAPTAAQMANFKTFSSDVALVANELAKQVSITLDTAKLTDTIVANLALTGNAATIAKDYLSAQFKANPNAVGKVITDAMSGLQYLTADANFGAVATAFNTAVAKGVTYAADATKNNDTFASQQAAVAAGTTNTGGTAVDTGVFSLTNDTVTVSATTLNAGDTYVDPSTTDADVLTLNLQGNVVNPLLGTRFVNIETMAINVQGLLGTEVVAGGALSAGSNLDFAAQTQTIGLKTITVSGDARGSLGLLSVRDEVTRVDASLMADDQNVGDLDGINLNFMANINNNTTISARTILGAQGNDSIVSTGGADTINGNRGNDTINGAGGNDSINGGDGAQSGNDSILAGAGNDTVIGGAGNDTIRTETGADSVTAGDGNDVVEVSVGATGSAAVTVLGGTGTDFITVNGSTGGVSIDGQDDNDNVFFWNATTVDATMLEGGLGGNDTMTVADSLNAAVGQNLLNKSTGFETYAFTDTVTLNGETSTDTIALANNVFSLAGKTANLTATATYAVNLTMGSGNDTVTGSTGNDTLTGGAGADVINGGKGSDTFVFDAVANGSDSIGDFAGATGGVRIDQLDFTAFLGSVNAALAPQVANNADLTPITSGIGIMTGDADRLISAAEVVTAATGGRDIIIADNQKAVVLVTNAANTTTAGAVYNVYYVQDTNGAAGAQLFTVTLAGTVTQASGDMNNAGVFA